MSAIPSVRPNRLLEVSKGVTAGSPRPGATLSQMPPALYFLGEGQVISYGLLNHLPLRAEQGDSPIRFR
jgi:hypothetical protein